MERKITCAAEKYLTETLDKGSLESKGSLDDLITPDCPFPREAFPPEIRNIIHRISEAQNVEFEFVASALLTIVGGLLGNTIRVSPKTNYEVPPFIWLIIIGESGYGKTPPLELLLKHVKHRQSIAFEAYKKEEAQYEEQQKRTEMDSSEEPIKKPKLKQLYMNDFTVEALADAFDNDPRGVIIYKDELSGLIRGLDQYKGKGNDRQHYIQLFNAGAWKVDRKSGVKFIPLTGASILGGIQPHIMTTVFSSDFFDDGFLPRFLLLNTEERPMVFNRSVITDEDLLYWSRLCDWCYDRPLSRDESGDIKPQVLMLEGSALDLWEEHYNALGATKLLLSDHLKIFIPKLAGYYSLKFAGILHCINLFAKGSTVGSVIGVETVHSAIALTNYFTSQTLEALKLYNPTPEVVLTELQMRLLKTIRELRDAVKNGLLPLKVIRDSFNVGLLETMQLTDQSSKRLGGMLRVFGLRTVLSTGGVFYLVWDADKIQSLFKKYDISTLSTNSESIHCTTVDKVDKVDKPADTDRKVTDLDHLERR